MVVAVILSLLVAGAGLTDQMSWKSFVAVFCASCASNFLTFLKEHPVESIQDTQFINKTNPPPTTNT